MKILRVLFPVLLLISLQSAAQNIRRIGYVIDSLLAYHTVSANILIATDSKIIIEKNVGFASITDAKPLQKSNVFFTGQLSMQFTAFGIMLLKQKGLLAYDSSVQAYLPEFPYTGITIRHLLTHTSGLPGLAKILPANTDTAGVCNNQLILNLLAAGKPPLLSQPGSIFELSTVGYELLALIIERITGKTYHSYMRQSVFRAAKMFSTSAEQSTGVKKIKNIRLAYGHVYDSAQQSFTETHLQPVSTLAGYCDGLYGSNSVTSSVFDLFIWHRVLSRNLLLPAAVQQEAFTAYTFNGMQPKAKNGKQISYGFGCAIGEDDVMGEVLFHNGSNNGYTSYYYRFPDKKLCFVFLSNAETSANGYLRTRILELLKE
jgi:CubicO group peptidase (beta-lactamase class C family)